jgi:hypothetical protein
MASWRCLGCRTVYAVGIPACPHCGVTDYDEGDDVAKASAEGGATLFVAEGQPVPGDLADGVRLVGPGAPAAAETEPAEATTEADAQPAPTVSPGGEDDEDGPPDYAAYRIVDLRALARERGLPVAGAKADLAARLAEYDAEHAEPAEPAEQP